MKNKFLIVILGMFALLAAGCVHNPEQFYFGSYSQAEYFYNKGQYERAIQKYQAYIDENPEGHLAIISQYYIGRSHRALGHTEEARQIFQDIVQKHPDVVWANFSETQLKEIRVAQAPPPPSQT